MGTYHLANLLQELALASSANLTVVELQGSHILENPVDRIARRINTEFWTNLTRRMDRSFLASAFKDTKVEDVGSQPRIYIPHGLATQHEYYSQMAKDYPDFCLDVSELPENPNEESTAKVVRAKPGLLALGMQMDTSTLQASQYVVPGGRFNELYGWDSYFCAIGLLEAGKTELVVDMVHNLTFEIEHYGCILNANRSYYLGRSQPPFLTDLVIRTYRRMRCGTDAENFLKRGILFAIKEYHQVWTSRPRLDPVTDLSRYRPSGHGIPPEVESGHYDWILEGYAKKHGMVVETLREHYDSGRLHDPDLDRFFAHDRACRESGHDTW
jgi:alpha,alpha-trehalase